MSLTKPSPLLRSNTISTGCLYCHSKYQFHHSDTDLPVACSTCQEKLSGDCFMYGKFINPPNEKHRLYWNKSNVDISNSTINTILEDNNIDYKYLDCYYDLNTYVSIEEQLYKVKYIYTLENIGIGLLRVTKNRIPIYKAR